MFRQLFVMLFCILLGFYSTMLFAVTQQKNKSTILQRLEQKAPQLNKKVLGLALTAYMNARKMGLDDQKLLTVIDYHLDAVKPRLWVFDMNNLSVRYHTLVTHGSGSGDMLKAHYFSNYSGSHESSIGVFLTADTYYGHEGYSLRLKGLEKGFNDHALSRHIVVHGAWYASQSFASHYHYLGRSWGCPAVDPRVVRPLINTIKNGTIVFAYYPEKKWLQHSRFLAKQPVVQPQRSTQVSVV